MAETKVEVKKEVSVSQKVKDERMWAMFCHLSGLAGFIIPFGNIVAPLIIWSIKKDEFSLVSDQGKEALNFQISVGIYLIVAFILSMLLIGIPLLIAIFIGDLVLIIMASVAVNKGEKYKYPLTLRLVK